MKTFIYTILVFGILITAMSCKIKNTKSGEQDDKSVSIAYELVWEDDFNYDGLPDSTKWDYDTEGNPHAWGNNEAQFYTRKRIENAKVEDGVLKIIALKESYEGREYTSARLFSKADWKYGRFETRAKLPSGRGTWSAIWMMPGGWSFSDGNWPEVGEFDIMEHVGYNKGLIHASAHSKDYQWQNGTQKTDTIRINGACENFHTYTWEWSPETVRAYVDEQLFFEYKNEGLGDSKWPYNKPFYLILNVAVGGAWGSVEGIDNESFPQIMEVDYVRVFKTKHE